MKRSRTLAAGLLALALTACAGASSPSSAPPDLGLACPNVCRAEETRCADRETLEVCADRTGDGCPEWGSAVTCPAGTGCEGGACIGGCSDACVEGEFACTAEGLRTCGDVDGDGCLNLGDPAPCPDGQPCGALGCERPPPDCLDECPAAGARRCNDAADAPGVQRCGRYDADACLEWGESVPCDPGLTCASGECVVLEDCAGACTPGDAVCTSEAGLERCEAAAPCPRTVATACAEGERCDDGQCVPADAPCVDACAEGEQVCSGGAGFTTCGQFDADPCRDRSPEVPCAAEQVCAGAGQCVEACAERCVVETGRCGGNGPELCEATPDGCGAWNARAACGAGTRCEEGACVPVDAPCRDACVVGERRCADARTPERCGEADDGDLCTDWLADAPCDVGFRCDAGACAADCVDDCAQPGATLCVGGAPVECGRFDPDPCLDLSAPQPCAAGTVCSAGECLADCVDECAPGTVSCVDGVDAFRRCGAFDADPCADWSSPFRCGVGEACDDGACVDRCGEAACVEGTQRCDAGAVQIERCTRAADGCLEWRALESCAPLRCSAAVCFDPDALPLGVGVPRDVPGLESPAGQLMLDVSPVRAGEAGFETPGFVVTAAHPRSGVRVARLDLEGRLLSGPHDLGQTALPPFGANSAYFPSLVTTPLQTAVVWSAFAADGDRDIWLRRLDSTFTPIAVANPIISGNFPGYQPVGRAAGAGLQVLYGLGREVRRIDVSEQGMAQAPRAVTPAHGETREETWVDVAAPVEGGLGLVYILNRVDLQAPQLYFRRMDASLEPQAPEVLLGEVASSTRHRSAWLFPLSEGGFGVVSWSITNDVAQTKRTTYTRLTADGAVQSRLVLNELARPAYEPSVEPESVYADAQRIGVVHQRFAQGIEPPHVMVQWFSPAGADQGRTELGPDPGVIVQHPDDLRLYLVLPGSPVRIARLVQ